MYSYGFYCLPFRHHFALIFSYILFFYIDVCEPGRTVAFIPLEGWFLLTEGFSLCVSDVSFVGSFVDYGDLPNEFLHCSQWWQRGSMEYSWDLVGLFRS